jgi:hypothetical protein
MFKGWRVGCDAGLAAAVVRTICHPERSEGGMTKPMSLHVVQGDKLATHERSGGHSYSDRYSS